MIDPSTCRQQGFDALDLALSEIKKIETEKGMLKLKLAKQDVYRSPMYLLSFTPSKVRSITRTVRAAMVRLRVSFATWEKSVDDQQQLLAGKTFKSIPIQPASPTLVQEAK